MTCDYREHRAAFLQVLNDAQKKYRDSPRAATENGSELLGLFDAALESKGPVRLFKYQPFSERNLRDCDAGVLHLSKLSKLNDVNEGYPVFDKAMVANALSSVDPEQVNCLDADNIPQSIRDQFLNNREEFHDLLVHVKESGELANNIAPGLAPWLEKRFRDRRAAQLCGSLSTTVVSASMWDRYADRHRGFATGYTQSSFIVDYSHTRGSNCTYGFKALLAPMFYGERQDLSFLGSYASIHDPELITSSNIDVLLLAMSLLQKAREWEHEQEWRVITYLCRVDSETHYCKIRPDSIYLGLNMRGDDRDRAIEIAEKNDWRVFEMERSYESPDWALDARPL